MTTEELIAELTAALAANQGPDDALTTYELCQVLGLAENATRKRIRLLTEAGRLEAVRVQRVSMNGVTQPVSAYRLKP